MTTKGLEPSISWFVVRRLIHWATRPVVQTVQRSALKHIILKELNSLHFSWHKLKQVWSPGTDQSQPRTRLSRNSGLTDGQPVTRTSTESRLIAWIMDTHTVGQPRRDSNPQSSDSKSDALSIRPRGLRSTRMYSFFQNVSGMKSPLGLIP